ncbi:MAG: DNA replication/repair protein RecF [Xanthomonadales bacterium]
MIVKQLQAGNFRNLEALELRPHPRLNYFWGENGAGKTSVLEALVVLARGRSFRTSQSIELVGPAGRAFHVFAEIENEQGARQRLGLERAGRHWRGRLDGRDLAQLSQLTRCLPLVLMEPDSHLLVSGPPEVRRKYLDWGMFHVEQDFLADWRSYSRALKQRNAALRRGESGVLDSLDAVVAEQGERLGALRRRHAEALAERINGLMEDIGERFGPIDLRYQDGWSKGSLLESLQENRKRDLERGLTGSGPHRADLALLAAGQAARMRLSRGEQKALAAALLLTQAEALAQSGPRPILLLDDLVSEFDEHHFKAVLERAGASGAQLWLTGTQRPELPPEHTMFHVKQGRVAELV